MRFIYGVFDRVAGSVTGGLMLFAADAVAVRTFGDICRDPNTMMARHPNDYDLVRLGILADNGEIGGVEFTTVITGAAFAATQEVDK